MYVTAETGYRRARQWRERKRSRLKAWEMIVTWVGAWAVRWWNRRRGKRRLV